MKPHTAGILAMLTSIVGALSEPQALHLLPANYATGLFVAGIILQGITKPVHVGGTDLVPKEPAGPAS